MTLPSRVRPLHLRLRAWLLCCAALVGWGLAADVNASGSKTEPERPSFAFYYGQNIPWESLGAFDMVVVEPGHVTPAGWQHRLNPKTQVAAYIAVGEVHPTRPYFSRMLPQWKLGENADWGSIVVDQRSAEWHAFYLREVVEPLWQRGFRAFFLDTLDSFYLVAKTPQEQKAQIQGMATLVRAIKKAHPEVKLIFNRGFEFLPEVHTLAYAVAAESLYQGFDAGKQSYKEVPQADRDWLWAQLRKCKDEYKLHVIAIDYVAPEQRELARATAAKISALGAIAWVANPQLNMLGVGEVEVLPRYVLAIHDEPGNLAEVALHELHRLGTMPLNQLGLDAQLVYVGSQQLEQLAAAPLLGRYAGVVIWLNRGTFPAIKAVNDIIFAAQLQGVPLVLAGAMPSGEVLGRLGLDASPPERIPTSLQLEKFSPHVGFEVEPKPLVRELVPIAVLPQELAKSQLWLRAKAPSGRYADLVAITSWGGFAAERYWKTDLPQDKGERWAINPIEFFKAALRIDPHIPMPDVTTEHGRRILTVHVDGDGFASRAEIPGTPLASEVMLREFLQNYPVPSTVSIIQGEVAGSGLYAALSPQLEGIAKRIFALPHVEIASHTFSHPFYWADAELGKLRGERPVSLKLPGYTYNVDAEIARSAAYINTRLAPPGKTTRMLLWSGDTQPLETPLRKAYEAGLLNMNGGNTWIRKSDPSLTLVGPVGMQKGEYYQIYAPNQNENVYTNDWTGPFYGFERVIETFEMTELPLRLKPVNIYYHTYIASKQASIASLHKVYRWAMAQPLHPLKTSEFAERVLDWRRATVARTVLGGQSVLALRGGGPSLRQWRVSSTAPLPAMGDATGWVGHVAHEGTTYLHALGSAAWYPATGGGGVAPSAAPAAKTPATASLPVALQSANGRVVRFEQVAGGWLFAMQAHVPLRATFRLEAQAGSQTCSFDAARSARGLRATTKGDLTQIESDTHATQDIVFRCAQ